MERNFISLRFWIICLVLVLGMGFFVVAAPFTNNNGFGSDFGGATNAWQYYEPSFNQLYSGDVSNYWPILSNFETDQCKATSDFAIMIPPGGCSPSVVRSDLLAEQNVPVFCQLQSVQLNPLIEVSSIKSISFKGDYPDGVSGISFHPARAATRSYRTLLGNPVINNIGYVVIILKREKVEDNLEEWIAGNLTATIRYDAEEAFGVGQADYYLPTMSDADWEEDYVNNAFWKGRGYLRLADVNQNSATVQIYNSKDNVYRTVTLQEGQTSELSYFPGYYCMAGMKVKLHKVSAPGDSVLLNVDGQESWYRKGSKFLNGKCSVSSMKINEDSTGSVSLRCPGQTINLALSERNGELQDATSSFDADFSTSLGLVEELVGTYGSVKKDVLLETYGEEALIEQIGVAAALGKMNTLNELLDLFLENYPESDSYDVLLRRKQNVGIFDYSSAYGNVIVTNKPHSIGISEFAAASNFSKNATLVIGSRTEKDKHEGDVIEFNDGDLTIEEIDVTNVRLSFKSKDSSQVKSGSTTILEGAHGTLGGRDIKVSHIDLKEFAYVSLIPEVRNTKTEADFTFRVGIEKRAIDLNPEKTEEMLTNINASIDKWNGINERLGDIITTWKAACFATSSYLMLKNVASGLGGEGIARQKVMNDYKSICDGKIANEEFSTRTQCYNNLSEEIDADVAAMTGALGSVNDDMESVYSSGDYVEEGILGDTINNQEKYVSDLKDELDSQYPGGWSREVNGQPLDSSDLTTSSQVRAALLVKKLEGTGGVSEAVAKTELDNILKSVASIKSAETKTAALQGQYQFGNLDFPASSLAVDQANVVDNSLSVSKSELLGVLGGEKNLVEGRLDNKENSDKVSVQIVKSGPREYLFVLDEDGSELGIFEVEKSTNFLNVVSAPDTLPRIDGKSVHIVSGGECSNRWLETNARVKYYASGENKGLPAIVPFDLYGGWYAMVPNSAGTFLDDSPQGYKASGQVSYFKICNVGPDGLENAGTSDDFCQSFSAASAGAVDDFPLCTGMTSSEVQNLYSRASLAIKQASSQYGQKSIRLFDDLVVGVGDPASFSGSLECQDFMSPEDCKLMFNACDPVICPSSRCDLGGKMPVADVIQTGIVGSLMLCLPNAKEGIYVPICLSGVHAGIESYVSILDSEKACLERSLETGEHVGICDEITSIYKCEFFWKQAAPITELAFQKLIGAFTGSSSPQGGGEYLFVPGAFDNLEKSLSFFRNSYAPNAFKAFEVRSVDEAGGEFCRAFIGTSLPTSAEGFDSLLAPESPTQFYAHFSEDTLSDVTLPATSHYKVFYHIFAGNDKGVQYRVYLKNPPESSYYSTNPTLSVRTGYIAVGETRDESIDFTAPEGYKELCVVIDAQEYCGFGSVTTDVGLKLVQESYVSDQAAQSDIQTEKECISGTPSLAPTSLNLQDVAEDSINPDIISHGIVRICSNEIQASSRWKDVGYCGDVNLRCYLDMESVEGNLKTLSAFGNYTINELEANKNLVDEEIKTNREVRALLGTAEEDISSLQVSGFSDAGKEQEVVAVLDKIIGVESGARDVDKARALFLKAKIYWGKIWFGLEGISVTTEPVARDADEVSTVEEAGGESEITIDPGLSINFSQLSIGDSIVELSSNRQFKVVTLAEKNNGGILVIKLEEVLGSVGPPEARVIEVSSDSTLGDHGYTFYFAFGDLNIGSIIFHTLDEITYTVQEKDFLSDELITFKILSDEGTLLTFTISSGRTLAKEDYEFVSL